MSRILKCVHSLEPMHNGEGPKRGSYYTYAGMIHATKEDGSTVFAFYLEEFREKNHAGNRYAFEASAFREADPSRLNVFRHYLKAPDADHGEGISNPRRAGGCDRPRG